MDKVGSPPHLVTCAPITRSDNNIYISERTSTFLIATYSTINFCRVLTIIFFCFFYHLTTGYIIELTTHVMIQVLEEPREVTWNVTLFSKVGRGSCLYIY